MSNPGKQYIDHYDDPFPKDSLAHIVDFLQAKVFLNTCSRLFNKDLHTHANLLAGSPLFDQLVQP